jgi:predicted ATPase
MRAIDAPHFWLEARFERRDGWAEDAYPFNLPVLRGLHSLVFHPAVTFLVGENGSGKSTLIEALAVAWGFNPEGGSTGMQFGTRPSHSLLHRFVRPVRGRRRPKDGYFLRAESFFNAATYIEEIERETGRPLGGYGGQKLHAQSHGESFFTLFENRFGPEGLYILDEPEAALSPSRQLSLLVRMHDLVRAGSQFIVATHSPILLGYPEARILQADASGLSEIAYEDADLVRTTRSFLLHRPRMLSALLDDDDAAAEG